mmetsp:Transcript_32831/g.79905  ORF Transcript_32831/g.79905 Transcript_32831/m.79905 type:complete len:84 (-) Transcript_32831:182-433(-)
MRHELGGAEGRTRRGGLGRAALPPPAAAGRGRSGGGGGGSGAAGCEGRVGEEGGEEAGGGVEPCSQGPAPLSTAAVMTTRPCC